MTDVAARLLEGIDEDAVDFRETYDGSEREPVVLPANFPNLLANGASGIAVGMATNIPPHNVAELCEAALHLIKKPSARIEELVQFVPGPDFPTGGVVVEPPASVLEAYRTGRGGFRLRARWRKEDQGRGTWVIVVHEIPFQVQKARLIEKLAELIEAKKLPLLADVRDESAEDVRIVLEPKSRSVEPELLMASLFRLTELETRISLNMNVLSRGQVPMVMGLKEALQAWLDHRREVLLRRSNHRLAAIARRLEILEGYLVIYLNLDEVIRIIREEDEPKPALMETFELSDLQAEAVLNMRLRNLRRLEEMEIRREHKALSAEQADLRALVGSDKLQWKRIADDVKALRKAYGPETPLGRRRTGFAEAPVTDLAEIQQAMIEREPITVVLSEKGWIRALKGHVAELSGVGFKGDDALGLAFPAETTDRIVLVTSKGRAFTLAGDRLPGGRGHGEPVRLMADIEPDEHVISAFAHKAGAKRLIASNQARGFVVGEDDLLANTRKGRQVMPLGEGEAVAACVPAEGDTVAAVGENRKLLLFPLKQVPEMARGRGVRLQRYAQGGLSDVKVFRLKDGLTWTDSSGRTWTVTELQDWRGDRAGAGRLPPKGFPRNNRFAGKA